MAKVLIADDDPFLIKIYSTRMKQDGHEVITCLDGQTALEYIKKDAPDLVILDIMMPRLHGLDVLAEMRENKKLKDVPVIFFSNLTQPEEREEAARLGAAEFLEKAKMTPSQVMEILQKYIGNSPKRSISKDDDDSQASRAKE